MLPSCVSDGSIAAWFSSTVLRGDDGADRDTTVDVDMAEAGGMTDPRTALRGGGGALAELKEAEVDVSVAEAEETEELATAPEEEKEEAVPGTGAETEADAEVDAAV